MTDTQQVTGARIQAFIDRIERLEANKKDIADDIKDIYAEAKSTGFEVKIIRNIIKLRKIEANKRREEAELLELYQVAIGMEA